MAHLRYPEDLFKVQREMLAEYHVTDAGDFYGGQDFWRVPDRPDPGRAQPVDQPPYYLSIAMPGQDEPRFSLTSTFMPFGDARGALRLPRRGRRRRDDRTASERRATAQLRLLELPKDSNVKGPGQVQNDIDVVRASDAPRVGLGLAQFLNIQRQQGSSVMLRQPADPAGRRRSALRRSRSTSRPTRSRPTRCRGPSSSAFGDKLAWSATLDGALDALFGGNSGAKAGDNTPHADTPTTQPATGTDAHRRTDRCPDQGADRRPGGLRRGPRRRSRPVTSRHTARRRPGSRRRSAGRGGRAAGRLGDADRRRARHDAARPHRDRATPRPRPTCTWP